MIFNSLTFLVFLTVFVVAYWMLPQKIRIGLIFSASIVFYGFWRIEFVPLMLISATVDYFAAIAIFNTQKI